VVQAPARPSRTGCRPLPPWGPRPVHQPVDARVDQRSRHIGRLRVAYIVAPESRKLPSACENLLQRQDSACAWDS